MTKIKSYLTIALNAVIIIAVILCLHFMALRPMESMGVPKEGEFSYNIFLYENVYAAILLGVGSIAMIVAAIIYLVQKRPALGYLKNAYILKMVATVWECYVFIISLVVMGPSTNFGQDLVVGEQVVLNFILPIVAMCVFTFLEYKKTSFFVIFYSLIPPTIFMLIMIAAVYTGGAQKAIGEEAPYIVFYFKTNPPVPTAFINIALILAAGILGVGIYFANWAMFEKAYPRYLTWKYQQQLHANKT